MLSSAAKTTAPGAKKNDSTWIDESFGTASGVSPAHRYLGAGTYPLLLVVTDAAGASSAAATTVTVK